MAAQTQKYPITRTDKSKSPALWEQGGSGTNTGHATIIAMPDGGKPKAIFTVTRGPRACGEHALVVVRPGMYIVEASRWRQNVSVRVMRIVRITENKDEYWAEVEELSDIPPELGGAVAAAEEKAKDYHCRTPYWVREQENR